MDSYFAGRVLVREATLADAKEVATSLREADARELWSAYRQKPYAGCRFAVGRSEVALCIEADGRAIAIFGVRTASFLDGRGIVWLLATDGILAVKVAVQRYTRKYVNGFLREWNSLENWVHAENKVSLRWLKGAGFSFAAPAPYGFDNEAFVHVRRER